MPDVIIKGMEVTTMRLIEVNTLKEWVENWFTMNRHYHPYAKSNNIPIPELYDILERMPTIDAVPVVRCKECYLGRPIKFADGSDMIGCDFDGGITRFPDFYCKAGDRKDGAE